MEFLYRYRSIDKLFEYKELENLEIYFAKPEELNDQMENYMNIVWQGDEIAFQCLFKHYLYLLTHLYYEASIRNRYKRLDIDHLPVFLKIDILNAPEIKTFFKEIYFEFFSSQSIANIPKNLAQSNKKFTADEILLILKSIHLYAYYVIDSNIKQFFYRINPFQNKEYSESYIEVKNWDGCSKIINLLIGGLYYREQIVNQINNFNTQYQINKAMVNNLHQDKDTYNINILSFDFPDIYIKNIKKLLYNSFCVTCFSATFQNEPMWAHYANNENGVCLRYKIKNENNKKFINLKSAYGDNKSDKIEKFYRDHEIFAVNYSDVYPEIDFFTSLGCLPRKILEDFWLTNYDRTQFSSCLKKYDNHNEWYYNYHKKATEYICTKSKNWEYEQEYRIILRDLLYPAYEEKQNRLANYKFEDLDAIIFGRNVSIENKRKVVWIINKYCLENKVKPCSFYDLYYSTISKELGLKYCPIVYFVKQNQNLPDQS